MCPIDGRRDAMILKDLYRMAIFTKVVEAGSFSKAGVALGLGKSVVSQHILTLEKGLGAQLINRSPRSLSLTDEGRRFHEACQRMMEQADAAFSSVDQLQAEPRGTLRISASYNLGLTFLIAELSQFLRRHPHVQIELVLEDAIVNVIEEGFDLCLRVGWLKETRLHALRLGTFRLIPCASAAFLARHAAPGDPSDLATMPWVSITQLPHPDRLELVKNDRQRRSVRVVSSVKTNTGIGAKEFVLNGDLVGLLPDYAILDDLREGRLVRLLPEWSTPEGTISAVFPQKEHMTPRLRLLLDHLRAAFQRHYGRTLDAAAGVRPVSSDAVSSKNRYPVTSVKS
jgi:DNA-binding transcriptional LysR family regulator